jgi:hypothetical protein
METGNLGKGSRVVHPSFGSGIVVDLDPTTYKIYFYDKSEVKSIAREFSSLEIVEKIEMENAPIALKDIEKALENVLQKNSELNRSYPMAAKWIGGTMTFQPPNVELSEKTLPIVTFFHKIVMVRERLRVLEQNINNHAKLDDEDRIHLQQYITRAYGSLTTFNVLFANKNDHFKGSGGEKD